MMWLYANVYESKLIFYIIVTENCRLMVKGLFHRATKIERSKKEKDKLKKKKKEEEIEEDKVKF